MRRALTAPAFDTGGGHATFVLMAALLALLGIRLVALALNGTDLFFDEAQYWTWAREPAFGYYSKPPLVAALIGASSAVCGDGTFCVRLASPILHTITAGLLFLVGRRLYDDRVGLWAALSFATLPGVALSSGIISTDVPLLASWALALLGLVGLIQQPRGWAPAAALALGIGLGLNAKYAMAFFLLCLAVWMLVTPTARRLLRDPRLWVGLLVGLLFIAPNLTWNAMHKFATFAHTADNAKWGGRLLQVGKGLEFVASQAGVFGPILLGGLVLTLWRGWKEGLSAADRLLVCFVVPVLAVITVQAFLSRAHANWAATAYVAGSVLVPAVLLRLNLERWLKASLALHLVIMALLVAGTSLAGRVKLPIGGDPFARTLGWKELGARTEVILAEARAAGHPFTAVIADERAVTAELLYYLRRESTPIRAWLSGPRPLDHYEMTRPFQGDRERGPVLLVSVRQDAERITDHFGAVSQVRQEDIPAGFGKPRRVLFIKLEDYKGG